ncbi:MAG TPA: isoleucine--tRNA ligase [Frankiaceae bacterium]|jgi:isoleucyl-tRNA synthetase|nr:isoleucine--tRNA ligase [Frankiaceae bacterium]
MPTARGDQPRPFRALPGGPPDLPSLDAQVLARWHQTSVFDRSMAQTADGASWVFYEGPPTANGKPGAHHVEARVFKDLFPRFKTMKGYHVPRRAGWDCHGLPVELAIEKELGFNGKQDIEAYGVAAFNEKCRESVLRHVDEFERLTERMGYWTDLAGAYRTMDTSYIESVWWSLKTIWDKGLLVQDNRVAPYCPRCQTALSDHEVAMGYTDVVDPSVYVRFPAVGQPYDLLVWTTTPWTLVSNTAVAVHPGVTYSVIEVAGQRPVLVAQPLVPAIAGDDAVVLQTIPGRELEGIAYVRPLDLIDKDEFGPGAHQIVLADYVTVEDGTGLVHQAPAFGAEDLEVARRYGLGVVNPIRANGTFDESVPLVGGMFFKSADEVLVSELERRGVLWSHVPYEHSYPLCWRCDTPLLYYALPSWYIRTTAIKDRLLAENEATDWHPARIKHGRYGEWLRGNVDWALSRNRYWGTPLPIWICGEESQHRVCVGSLTELGQLAGQDLSALDPHRPFVDDVVLACAECGGQMRRVPEVIDVWYDSGAMPFAQWGAPHQQLAEFEASYPAQYICEAIDQTRGWFYTLMAIGTLVFDKSSYETVLCLGLLLDGEGRKMSKHLGNVLDPFELFDRHGADAVRWLMLAGGSPWMDRRVGHENVEEVVRKVLLTYYNTASFFLLYASTSDWRPGDAPPEGPPHVLDRWARSELAATVTEVDAALEDFDSARAGKRIASFLDDLSNWYVRRSRRRFWAGDPAALATLHECLQTVTRLMAPLTPFLTDWLWPQLAVPQAPDSVHLAAWPVADASAIDEQLSRQMVLVRRLVELGRAARASAKLGTRQPLARAGVPSGLLRQLAADLVHEVAEELNVLALEALDSDLVDVAVKPNFRALGKRFGSRTKQIAAAVAQAGKPVDGRLTIEVDGEAIELSPEELIVTETPQAGWAVVSESGASVALDLTLTDELRRAGLARDVVRRVQEARKQSGLDVSDRIELWWQAEGADAGVLAEAIREHAGLVAGEVLATSFKEGKPPVAIAPHHDEGLGLTVWLRAAGE